MKTILIHIGLSLLLSNYAFAQEWVWGQEKDRVMLKIDNIVYDIDHDTLLVRFWVNENLTKVEIDSSRNIDNIESISDQTLPSIIPSNCYYLKDSVIVKLIYDGQSFYFLNEDLIMYHKRYDGFSDNTTQCCPITVDHYHYYWKKAYYKSFEKRDSNCSNPCSMIISSIDTKTMDLAVKKIKKLANENK